MIEVKNISHYYKEEQVLFNISFKVKSGEFLFLNGESGSGKSTLLSIMSTLLKQSSGDVIIDNINTNEISSIDSFRQNKIGFVFQFHYLIDYLTLKENIELVTLEENKHNITPLLDKLGIKNLADRYPNEISGGQRQRVALARALANNPKIIFADEPTGSLDSKNSKVVYELLHEISQNGTTVIVASHDMRIHDYATSTIRLIDGRI